MAPHEPEAPLYDYEPSVERFRQEVLAGLSQGSKRLPCKYFYDERGCQLFEAICQLDEYYLTRTELAIMQQHAAEMARALDSNCMLIEYGSGSSIKTRILLDHLLQPAAYVPVDIARQALQQTAAELSGRYGELEVLPVCADFLAPFELPRCARPVNRQVVYFPGSTIGNFEPSAAQALLRGIAELCGAGGGLLIGIDLQKEPSLLEAAYNDRQGVTAAFNLNLLQRINEQLGADFRLDQFRHHAVYNQEAGRVEIYLVSLAEQTVSLGSYQFQLGQGEAICTEHSHKYRLEAFGRLAARSGLELRQHWTDDQNFFAVLYFQVQ